MNRYGCPKQICRTCCKCRLAHAVVRGCSGLLAVAALVYLPAASASEPTAAELADLAELPIEQLLTLTVSSASRFNQKVSEAPSAVTVVTAAEIKAFGWRTLADLLRSVRGLYVNNDRNYSYLGARGFLRSGDYNSRFLLLIDGARTNDSVYDQAHIGYDFPLDIDLIERVEYVPGPGSSIYGANAFFGVINVISKRGRDLDGPQLALSAGSENSGSGRFSVGKRGNEGDELLLSATRFTSRGADLYFPEFDSARSNNGIASHLDYEQGQSFFLRAALGNLQLEAGHVERLKSIPTASFSQSFNDPRARTSDLQSFVDLLHRTVLSHGTEISARLHWSRIDYLGYYAYPGELVQDGSSARAVSGELKLVSTHFDGQQLVAGLDYQQDYQRKQFYFEVRDTPIRPMGVMAGFIPNPDLNSAPVSWQDDHTNRRTGLYVQDEITLGPAFLLNAGLRYDHASTTGGLFNPRLALIYKASPATTVKALYGSAFRAPNAYELYYMADGAGGQKANPGLREERIHSVELVLEYQLRSDARITATLYKNEVRDLISQITDPRDGLLVFRNLDRATAQGGEVELEKVWDGGSKLRLGVSQQHTVDGSTGAVLENSPRRQAKLNWSGPLWGGAVRSGVEAQYVGPRLGVAGRVGGYWLTNLNLFSTRLAHGMEISLALTNALDRRYADPASAEFAQEGLQQDGRQLRLKMQTTF